MAVAAPARLALSAAAPIRPGVYAGEWLLPNPPLSDFQRGFAGASRPATTFAPVISLVSPAESGPLLQKSYRGYRPAPPATVLPRWCRESLPWWFWGLGTRAPVWLRSDLHPAACAGRFCRWR